MNYAELRAIAEAASIHGGGWGAKAQFMAMTTPQFVLGLLDRAEDADRYEAALKNIVLADIALAIDGQRVTWPIEGARDALNPTEANDA